MTAFPTVSKLSKGYDMDAVDAFLEEAHDIYELEDLPADFDPNYVRNQTFPLTRGGYLPSAVDKVLERLDAAYGKRLRAQRVDEIGYAAWLDDTHELAQTLQPRLKRPEGHRFAHPEGKGYRISDVDELLSEIADFLSGSSELASEKVSGASFRLARSSKAYDMSVVDAYLGRVIQVLRSVE